MLTGSSSHHKKGERVYSALSFDDEKKLNILILQIVEACQPDSIYLFGSYAREEAKKHSAIDILIIGETRLRLIARIKKILHLNHGELFINPLYYTPAELRILKNRNDGFIISVFEEAKLLYKRELKG